MASRAHSVIKRAKKPKHTPMVNANFNAKFAEFAKRKGIHHGPLQAVRLGSKPKKAA